MVVFPEELNRKISLHIIMKGRSLHFNVISSGELMVYLQKEKSQVKVFWCKDGW